MKQLTTYFYEFLIVVLLGSCILPSTDKIKNLDNPDNSITKEFGIDIDGKIIYQFYQKYGFSDFEEQLILIVKTNTVDFLTTKLPFDSKKKKKLNRIDLNKFIIDKPINFDSEKTIQSDIRLTSKEYDARKNDLVLYNNGNYKLIHNDSIETIYVYDWLNGLMYIESKKTLLTAPNN